MIRRLCFELDDVDVSLLLEVVEVVYANVVHERKEKAEKVGLDIFAAELSRGIFLASRAPGHSHRHLLGSCVQALT